MIDDTIVVESGSASPSGKFVLRIAPGLHAALRAAAAAAGLSLNEYCARMLALPGAHPVGPATEAVARAAAVVGGALVGVVAFGSWARGEAAESSDVDLLVVVDDTVALSRGLYREWDRAPVWWDGHLVEPHFVRLPPPGARLSAVWAEVALDGVVLFDRGLAVSTRLVEFRARIAEGEVVRRRVHGQSYWVEAA